MNHLKSRYLSYLVKSFTETIIITACIIFLMYIMNIKIEKPIVNLVVIVIGSSIGAFFGTIRYEKVSNKKKKV